MIDLEDLTKNGDPTETSNKKIAESLNRSEEYKDGIYRVRIWGGDVHRDKDWIAWVDFYDDEGDASWIRDKYMFRIQVDGEQTLEWEVETYNPAFGMIPFYFHWHGDEVIFMYIEKHNIFGVTATTKAIKHRVKLGHQTATINLEDDIVTVKHLPTLDDGKLERQYRLPHWEQLD